MRKILLLVLISVQCNLFAQKFKIAADKKITTITSDTTLNYLEFTISESLRGRTITFYDAAGKTIVALKGAKLGTEIPSDMNGGFKITVDEQHKIRESDKAVNLPDHFKLTIDETSYGPFHLRSINTATNTNQPIIVSKQDKIYHPGCMFYDASYINNKWNQQKGLDTVKLILNFYGIYDHNIAQNSYLNKTLKNIFNSGQGVKNGLSASSLLSSVGGFDVTTLADGFAKFVVKRTKKELSITFFEKFKKEIDRSPDLKSVFPQTYRTLSVIGEQIYMYQSYLTTLKEAFEKDLSHLPTNLPSIIDNHQAYFNTEPKIKAALLSGFYLTYAITDQQHPGQIIERFPNEVLDELDVNLSASVKTFRLFSTSLKNNSNTINYWAPYTDIKQLWNDDQLFNIYLGLVEQKVKEEKIKFYNEKKDSVNLHLVIDSAYGKVKELTIYKILIKNIVQKTQSIESRVSVSKSIHNDSLLVENYSAIISNSTELMKQIIKIGKLPRIPVDTGLLNRSKKFVDILQTSSDIVLDVNRKNYSSAVLNSVHLLNYAVLDTTTKKLLKYGSFMATAAQANSSDEVEVAIEAVALPAGSARIKRTNPFNIALNAYTGLFVGYEQIQGVDKSFGSSASKINSYGVAAPIGISISTNYRGTSLSAFASVVDIGALAAFRFANDSTEEIPKIELKDIISPGAFISIGCPKTPLSINIGYQLGPLLRKVNQQANTYEQSYSRISISLCVDIPIFNFYTKPKE